MNGFNITTTKLNRISVTELWSGINATKITEQSVIAKGPGNDQLDQLMGLAQQAGIQGTSEFQRLLIESGIFGKGESSPQNLFQSLIGNPIRGAKSGLGSGFELLQQILGDFAVNTLPGRVT